ncbi:MAG: APC family permease [Candidatus Bathyarchaeia archaeon]
MERELGLFDAVMMGLSGAIGFEIFVLMDYAYFSLAGPSMILALLLGGFVNLVVMFSYCELSAAIPEVGGEYTYTKAAYGGLIAFVSGCLRWLASVFGAALAALVFAQQLSYLLERFTLPVAGFVSAQTPLIAIAVIIILAALDVKGVKKAGPMIVITFLALFAIFLVSGLWQGLTLPDVIPKPTPKDLSGVFAAAAYMFPMFFGMRALVAGAAQIKDPGKNVPKATILSALLIVPLYLSVAYVAVGVVPLEHHDDPFLNIAAENIMPAYGGVLFAIAGMVASLSALGTSIAVQSSIARGMSRDGYLPKILLSVHRRYGTPYIATIVGALFIIFMSVVGVMEFLGYAASFGSILVFALVNLSLMKLRKKKPYLKRAFKAPLYPFTPIAGVVMSVVLLVSPILIENFYAISALMSGLGLMVLVLLTYYLRMVGRYRLRIAMGGMSLGMGISTALLICLIETGFVAITLSPASLYVLIFFSVVSILAGILNVTVRTPKIF